MAEANLPGSGKSPISAFNIQDPRTWRRPFVVKTDGSVTFVQPKNGTDFDLEELQRVVGGYIEVQAVGIANRWIAVMNEEGKLQNLPINKFATEIIQIDAIAGDVLVCKKEMMQ